MKENGVDMKEESVESAGSNKKSIDELRQLAEKAIDEYFDTIENVINLIVDKIAEENKIEDEDDIKFLKRKIEKGILKLDG